MRRLSSLLLYAGGGICALGAIGIMGGIWVNLPPEVVRRIAMALPFAVGGALLLGGALLGRAARRPQRPLPDIDVPAVDAGHPDRMARESKPEATRHAPRDHDRDT